MAPSIIDAIRQRDDIKGTNFLAAREIAHAADEEGLAEISYDQLSKKMHMSVRTAKRRVAKLIQDEIIERLPHVLSVIEVAGQTIYRYAINTYRFLIPFERRQTFPSAHLFTCASWTFFAWLLDKMAQILPTPTPIGKKNVGLQEEIRSLEKGLRFQTPGMIGYEESFAKLQHLRALLAASPLGHTKEAPCPAS